MCSPPGSQRLPILVHGAGTAAQIVAAALIGRGHLVCGLLDENAPDPDEEGRMMVIRGIAGAPAEGLRALPTRAWMSQNEPDDFIVVVAAAGNGVMDIEESVARQMEMSGRGCSRTVNFLDICQAYPESGLKPSIWSRICQTRMMFLSARPDVDMGFMSYVANIPDIRNYSKDAKARLSIGAFSSIADDVRIFIDGAGNGSHGKDWVTTFPVRALWETAAIQSPRDSMGVMIGSDVWIGAGATILSGIHIGDGAIVGAGSVVSRDVEPYAVVAGNPARHKRYRFPQREREALLQARWWDWPWEEIQQVIPLLFSPRIEDFLHYAATRPEAPRGGALASFAAT